LDQHKVAAHLAGPDSVVRTVREKEQGMHSQNLFDAHPGFFPSLYAAVGHVLTVNAEKVVRSSYPYNDDCPAVLLLAGSEKEHST